jgi:hypothetical protein
MQSVPKQRIGKHASTIIELLLETVFPIRSVQNGYKEENWGNQFSWALHGKLRRDGAISELTVDKNSVLTSVDKSWAQEAE